MNTLTPLLKSFAVITCGQLLLASTRYINKSNFRLEFIRAIIGESLSPLSNGYFLSTNTKIKRNIFLLSFTKYITCHPKIEELTEYFPNEKMKRINKKILEIFNKFKYLIGYRFLKNCLNVKNPNKYSSIFYNNLLVAPVLEELFYRGLLQEVFLRQVPKFLIAQTSLPLSIDHPALKIARIVLPAFLFGISHGNDLFGKFLAGLSLGYETEHVGIGASMLSHYNHNLYVDLDLVTTRAEFS